jgi:hypothetical protein
LTGVSSFFLDSEAAATREYATKIFTFVGNFAPKEKAGVV